MSNEESTGLGALQEEVTTFHQQGREVGKFWYDEEKAQFTFEGNVKDSAEIFMLEILRQLNELLSRCVIDSDHGQDD